MASDEKEVALYYPYMDLADASLIKTAALYWDEVQTIVPESVTEPYCSEPSRDASQCGFLKARIIRSGEVAVKKVGEEFADDIGKIFVQKYIRTFLKGSKLKTFSLHYEKITAECLRKIQAALHIGDVLTDDQYAVLPEVLGYSYMSWLASIIAQQDKAVPLTNLSAFQDILNDRFIDYSDERRRNQSQLARMSLKTISIEPETPLIEILRFRDRHRKMMLNFRRQLRELSRQVAIGLNTAERERVLEEIIKDKVLPARGEIEAKLSEGDIAFGLSAMNIVQATLIGALASGGQSWITGIAGAGISLSISLVQSLREDRNITKEEPFGYLYQAQEKFGQKQ